MYATAFPSNAPFSIGRRNGRQSISATNKSMHRSPSLRLNSPARWLNSGLWNGAGNGSFTAYRLSCGNFCWHPNKKKISGKIGNREKLSSHSYRAQIRGHRLAKRASWPLVVRPIRLFPQLSSFTHPPPDQEHYTPPANTPPSASAPSHPSPSHGSHITTHHSPQ